MSTSDPGTRDIPTPAPAQNPAGPRRWDNVSAAMASLPDPAVIARLANEFFAALPGVAMLPDASGAPVPPAASPSDAGVLSASPAVPGAGGSVLPNFGESARLLSQAPFSTPSAGPSGSSFYFLEMAQPASPVELSLLPAAEFAPLPGTDLPTVPNNLAGTTGLPSQAAANVPGAEPSGPSFYFLEGSAAAPSSPDSLSLPETELFSLPSLPDLVSSLGTPVPPLSSPITPPTPADPPPASPTGVTAPVPEHPRAVPQSVEAVSLPNASTPPGVAAVIPPTGADFLALPKEQTGATDLPAEAAVHPPKVGPSESLSYFLDGEQVALPDLALPSPPASELFSFPGVPGLQSLPGIPALPSSPPLASPTEADLRALPASLPGGTALMPEVPSGVQQLAASPTSPYFLNPRQPASPAAPPLGFELFEFRPEMLPELGLTPGLFDPRSVRRDFPILQEQVHGRPLVWLDNAATTQKPNAVIDRLAYFYRHENSNVHRAAHTLAARSTDAYEGAREKVRRFLNASSPREIVFVRGTTEGINLVAKSWGQRNVGKDDEIVITWLEHHANIVPWQQLCAEKGARLRVAPVDNRGQVVLDEYEKLLNPRTRLVSLSHVSNALGTITPAREMVEIAHRHGACVLVDGAQSVAHMREDVQTLDCDFFVFSGHKIFAPTGIGVVYGKGNLWDTTPPWQGGGSMILDVTFEKTTYNVAPARFEAGTGSIADAVGLGAALDYLSQVGIENVTRYEHDLLIYATAGLASVPGLSIIGTAREKAGVLSFVLDGVRTEDVGKLLDEEGIAVRAGHHCAQPILRRFGVESTVRASLALYNTCEDIDALVAALRRIQAGRGHRGL